ncbi:MAG: RDD family protein [Acidimicrobiales bacterium]
MASPLDSADPTSVFARRALAAVIDALVILIPTFILLTASFEYLDVGALDRGGQQFCDDYNNDVGGICLNLADVNDRVYFTDNASGASTAMYWGGTFVLLVVVQGLTGRTIGKALTGVRTVREDGTRPGIGKAFVRWAFWVIDAFPYVVPLLGPILALTTQGHRRVGDMAAKTFVVRSSANSWSPIEGQ